MICVVIDLLSTYVCIVLYFFFFKQKTAYEMRISDWSSDVCSSDLARNSLALEVSRWASAANTLVTVIENVPPFLSSPQWRQLAKAFESAGNEVFTWTLDAVD